MSAPNDGGPAFPYARNVTERYCEGMTLRDYFAAAALTGMMARWADYQPPHAANDAYRYADAMLAERENRRQTPEERALTARFVAERMGKKEAHP